LPLRQHPSPAKTQEIRNLQFKKGKFNMDSPTVIRIVAGLLFVIVLVVLIQRRRTKIN
jgi:hypothetical protein